MDSAPFSILGSDSEDEMCTKWEYIEALKRVHQMDGRETLCYIEYTVNIQFIKVQLH